MKKKAKSLKKKLKLKVSPLFILMAAVMAYKGAAYDFVVYLVAVVLHELAHAEISNRLGYSLVGLKLNPYGAALTGKYEGIKWKDEIIIASAGPVFNILLAIPAVALWWVIPESYHITQSFVSANLFIAAFNALPIFPMDGGRILLAALSQKIPRERAYRRIRIIGFIFSGAFLFLFILTFFYKINVSFGISAIFMLVSTIIPDKNSYYQRLYSMAYRTERIKNGITVKEIMVSSDSTVLKLSKLLNGNFFTRFIVVDDDFSPLFCISETELEEIYAKANPSDNIVKAFKNIVKTVKPLYK